MSSTTDIEMAYNLDGPDALSSSDLLKTTNGDLLKMLLEMKKQMMTLGAGEEWILGSEKRQQKIHHRYYKYLIVYLTIWYICIYIWVWHCGYINPALRVNK